MRNILNKLNISRAFLHAVLIPYILLLITFIFEKRVTIIVPLTYVSILSILHLFRIYVTKDDKYIFRAKEYFEYVGTMLFFSILICFIILILAIE